MSTAATTGATAAHPLLALLVAAVACIGCASPLTDVAPKTDVRAVINDASLVLQPARGSEEIVLTVENMGTRPCPLVVFITDPVNGPVDPARLPVAGGVVDFDSLDFHEIEAAEGVEQGGPPLQPGERLSLTLGFKGTSIVTRVVMCNGAGDYEAGRYAVYQSDGT